MPKIQGLRGWLAACLAVGLAMAGGPARAQEPDAGPRPLRLVVSDIKTQEEIERDFAPFARVLGAWAGRTVVLKPALSRVEAAEALRSGRVDLVLIGPAEYVVFRKKSAGWPLAGLTRPGYRSLLVTLAGSSAQDVADLRGQKVVFGDVGSTSAHLGPMQLLADHGLDPRLDVKAIHADYLEGWAALKRGSAAALGSSSSYVERIVARDPEASAAMRVLASGPNLPGDILLAGERLDDAVRQALRGAVRDHGDELLQALLQGPGNGKYRQSRFVVDVRDADYDIIRKMYATAGFPTYADFLER